MSQTEFILKSNDVDIVVYKHTPEDNPKAVLVIVHGMAEHAKRYDRFANYLIRNGLVVYAHDQRGHGKTAGSIEKLGFFAEKDGWQKVVDDLKNLVNKAKEENPGLKIFLLGHSMGSFVVRTYLTQYSDQVNGAIFSGTAGSAGLLGKVGIRLTAIISSISGKRSLSPLLDKMSFGDFNKPFKPNRTKFDWLSRDDEEVDKYVNDPYCGTIFSIGFFNDMMKGLEYVNNKANAEKVRKDLPVYIYSGDKDPVSKNGSQIKTVYEMYKSTGISDISMKLYSEGRHEMLNETNREEVFAEIKNWLDSKI